MDEEYIISNVNKYKERLHPKNDIKKILRALQKLNEVDMTLTILKETEVGKAVNKLKNQDGIGSFAKEIVLKWKKLLQVPKYEPASTNIKYEDASCKTDEYDPTQNWEMQKLERKNGSRREEYDPTENWEMKTGKKSKKQKERDMSDPPEEHQHKVQKDQKKQPHKHLEVYHPKAHVSSKEKDVMAVERRKIRYDSEEDHHHVPNDADDEPLSDDDYPSSRGEDDDYPSSRGEDDDDFVNSYNESCPPSVTSKTVSEMTDRGINHYPSEDKKTKPITEAVKKSKKHKIKVDLDYLDSNFKSSERIKQTSKENLPKKKPVEKSSKALSDAKPKLPSKSRSSEVKKPKDQKKTISKRETADVESTSSKKIKGSKEIKKKIKIKTEKPDLSFEQFMLMDTATVKKKKKRPRENRSTPSPNPDSFRSSKKPRVELNLPKIQATYRPLPASSHSDSRKVPQKSSAMTDELAAALHTQRNSKKMQVYSGKKANCLPTMMSLYDQCMNVLLNNIDNLEMIGVPYDIIKPVLERCSVEQLYRLEDFNPYLLEDTNDLWKRHAQQDFRSQQPNELESWREMYLRLYDAREEKLTRLTHTIQAKVDKAKPLEKRTKLAYVGRQAKAPRNVLRAQLKYGTAGKKPIPYQSSSTKRHENASSSASSYKQQATDIRMSVPEGAITASTVDNMASRNVNAKKQVPRVAPMMAKTLKSINKLRYRR